MAEAPEDLTEALLIDADDIDETGLTLDHALPRAGLTALLAVTTHEPWTAAGDGQVSLEVTRQAERVRVRGGGATLLQHACVRCLREVRFTVEFALDVVLQKGVLAEVEDEAVIGTGDQVWDAEAIEMMAVADVVPFDGRRVDIAALVREQIFLEAPSHPSCEAPGAEPPAGDCTLDPDGALEKERDRWQDPRWDALRAMRDVLPPGDS